MFGLEDQKKKQPEVFEFDLEKSILIPEKNIELHQLIAKRLQQLKEVLGSGAEKETFEQMGRIFYGYQGVLKVIERAITKQKKK